MQIAVLGIDLGKNSCSVVGMDAAGGVVLRDSLVRLLSTLFRKYGDVFGGESHGHDNVLLAREDQSCPGGAHS